MMIVREPVLVTFLHNPKAGGTSIKYWLAENFNAKIPTIRERDPHSTDPSLVEGFSFCCVRNPWAKAFSTFNWLKRHGGGYLAKPYDNDFSKFIADLDNEDLKPFTNPQKDYVELSNYIMRYENFENDFKVIQDYFDCDIDLPHKNNGWYFNKYNEYKKHYTEEDKEKVYTKFRDDIDLLGYTFEE